MKCLNGTLTFLSILLFFAPLHGQEYPPIVQTARNGNIEALKAILQADSTQVSAVDDFGATALHWAALYGRREVVAELLKQSPNVNAKERHEGTTLHWAAHFDDAEIVSWLIEEGAEIDHRNRMGRTPLHVAARRGNLAVVRILVESGADVSARTGDGSSALHIAARNGHQKMLEELISLGVDTTLQTESGLTFSDEIFIRPDAVSIPAEVLASFAGQYRAEGRPQPFDLRWEDGRLVYYAFGRDELVPISESKFITGSEKLFFSFTTNRSGSVDALILETPSRQIRARRVRTGGR